MLNPHVIKNTLHSRPQRRPNGLMLQRQDSNLEPHSSLQSFYLFYDALIQSLIKKECKMTMEIKLTEKNKKFKEKNHGRIAKSVRILVSASGAASDLGAAPLVRICLAGGSAVVVGRTAL